MIETLSFERRAGFFNFEESKMPISVSDVAVGGHYLSGDEQERRVTKIEGDKVWYESRSYRLKNEWSFGHAKTLPPSIASFCEACYQVLSKP